ncbi:CobW family GTP-binding protein [Labrys monachus]|uniref:G3E family GTPase n=1 Tax=Labrys monachus TaxID=217067 RepID=A0ABU0FNU3_9HYPH|nr:GTP-binding protein [Labrys monachus]MDQ0396278.1 G3E family GTPase [Labrys monachus]
MTARIAIPAFVLTGFLGAGKTTLLNRLLKDPALADTAVVINEFGDAGLDHLLVEKSGDGVVLLASGCLCCSLRGDLVDTLADLAARRETGALPPFGRVVIETTGLAHPTPVLQTLMAPPVVAAGYVLAGVIAVADAQRGEALLDAHAESVAQIAVADRILVSKADLAGAGLDPFLARLGRLNPRATIDLVQDVRPGDLLAAAPLPLPPADAPAPALRLGRPAATAARPVFGAHDAAIASFVLTADKAMAPHRLGAFLDELRERHGDGLLRFKALVKLADDPERPVVIHGVQHVLHPLVRLDAWPDGDRRSRLVFIMRDVDRRRIEDLFAAFCGEPRLDAPDVAALTDNPLAF